MGQKLSEEHRVAVATAFTAGRVALKKANTPAAAATVFLECYEALGAEPEPTRPQVTAGPLPTRANSGLKRRLR